MKLKSRALCLSMALLLLLSSCGQHAGGQKVTEPAAKQAPDNAVSSDDRLTRLACGRMTYRLSPDKLSDEITAACERVKTSSDAEHSYRAAMARFTCQDSHGHVVLSLLVPTSLLADYGKNCNDYIAAEVAFESDRDNQSMNRQAVWETHRAAAAKFNEVNNQLSRKYGAELSGLYNQQQADQALLNKLIKDVGGSIEIRS